LKNLVTGEILEAQVPPPDHRWNHWRGNTENRVSFNVLLQPHSYAVFVEEN